jgi:hypothetical protein
MLARDKRQFGFRLMIYKLGFYEEAFRESIKLYGIIGVSVLKKLLKRSQAYYPNPEIESL